MCVRPCDILKKKKEREKKIVWIDSDDTDFDRFSHDDIAANRTRRFLVSVPWPHRSSIRRILAADWRHCRPHEVNGRLSTVTRAPPSSPTLFFFHVPRGDDEEGGTHNCLLSELFNFFSRRRVPRTRFAAAIIINRISNPRHLPRRKNSRARARASQMSRIF